VTDARPEEAPSLQIADIAAEMESDPLSRALCERAQYKILATRFEAQARTLAEQNQELLARIGELEGSRNGKVLAK